MSINTPNDQPQRIAYGQSQPLLSVFNPPILSNRAPTVNDRKAIGQIWVTKATNTAYIETSVVNNAAAWTIIAGAGASIFTSLTVTPGPISLTGVLTQLGTANINTSGAASSNIGTGSNSGTVSIGNASSTAVSILGPVNINNAGSQITNIGVAGTGAVNLGNATGNVTIPAGNLVATLGNITASAGNIAATLGSVTAGTTLTATLGNITATNGNLNLAHIGNKLLITTAASGTNASAGTTAAMAAGTIVVANTAVTAASIILVSHATAGGTMGILSIGTIVPGVSFAILTDNVLDISTVNFLIIN